MSIETNYRLSLQYMESQLTTLAILSQNSIFVKTRQRPSYVQKAEEKEVASFDRCKQNLGLAISLFLHFPRECIDSFLRNKFFLSLSFIANVTEVLFSLCVCVLPFTAFLRHPVQSGFCHYADSTYFVFPSCVFSWDSPVLSR